MPVCMVHEGLESLEEYELVERLKVPCPDRAVLSLVIIRHSYDTEHVVCNLLPKHQQKHHQNLNSDAIIASLH